MTNDSSGGKSTKLMLACGIISTPVFFGLAIFQILIRPGYNLYLNAISQLSLGNLGWIQISNFIITGLLDIVFAIGMKRRLLGGRAGSLGPWNAWVPPKRGTRFLEQCGLAAILVL
jgi:hypothetical protein